MYILLMVRKKNKQIVRLNKNYIETVHSVRFNVKILLKKSLMW